MKKKLTQAFIDNGERKSCDACPLALMLKEAMPGIRKIEVDFDTEFEDAKETYVPYVTADDTYVTFKHPDKIVSFIRKFDAGLKVKPFMVEWEDF